MPTTQGTDAPHTHPSISLFGRWRIIIIINYIAHALLLYVRTALHHIRSLFEYYYYYIYETFTLLAALSSKHCGDGVIRPRPQTARQPAKLDVRGHVGHRNRPPRRAWRTRAGGGRRARPDTRF